MERSIRPLDSTRLRIQRELALVARGRPPFVLLVFEVGAELANLRAIRTLIAVLRCRLRIGDEVGWLDHGRIAVVLPATDRAGGLALAADVRHRLARRGTTIPFLVHAAGPKAAGQCTYPWPDGGLGQLAPRVEITLDVCTTADGSGRQAHRRR